MSAHRPIILTFTRHYLPGYKSGGPIRSIANLVEALGDEFDFRIITSDRDATDAEPYPGLDARREWKSVGKAQVLYLPPGGKSLFQIARILRETPHDILYLNSFFDPVFTVQPLVARRLGLAPKARCIIAPRGEFSDGALGIKAWKKTPFLLAAKPAGLYRGLAWQASSAHEEADIRRVMTKTVKDINIAMDMPDVGVRQFLLRHDPRPQGGPLRVCFLSRISPMKNLTFALDVLARVQSPICFDVYGPIRDAAYWTKCQEMMASLPPHIVAAYRGGVEHAEVPYVLGRCDLFFLPTLGENYGHVILEALSVGTPVLIADTTPWRDLEKAGVGWNLSLDEIGTFVAKIDSMARMTPSELASMRERALAFAEIRRTATDLIAANRTLFMQDSRA